MASTSRGYAEKRGPGRWRARYRGPDGRERSKTFKLRMEAEAWLTSVAAAKQDNTWRDPGRGAILLRDWAPVWLASRSDLRPTSRQRLEQVMRTHVVRKFGTRQLLSITNGECRVWVAELAASAYPRRPCARACSLCALAWPLQSPTDAWR